MSPTDYVTDYVRMAGRVLRYHTWPCIQTQTIADHSWQVALIYEEIFGTLSPPVERYIRLHDIAELKVGDIPFPVKANNPALKAEFNVVEEKALRDWGIELPQLAPWEYPRVKVCDLLEMMLFGMTEREMGNMLAVPIITRTGAAALSLVEEWQHDLKVHVHTFITLAEKRHENVLMQSRTRR